MAVGFNPERLPQKFLVEFEGYQLEGDGTDNHDEAQVHPICGRTHMPFNVGTDTVSMKFEKTADALYFDVDVDTSHSNIKFWDKGTLSFKYDLNAKKWTMVGYVTEQDQLPPHLWAFCDPEFVVDAFTRGMRCFAASDESMRMIQGSDISLNEAVTMLAESIAADVYNPSDSNIMQTVLRWEGAGCNQDLESAKKDPTVDVTKLPERFFSKFDGFTINGAGRNQHDEAQVHSTCRTGTLINDDFNVGFAKTKDGFDLWLAVDSTYGHVHLWDKGIVKFHYNAESGKWAMSGSVTEWVRKSLTDPEGISRTWKFCDPEFVADTMVDGLRCFAKSEGAAQLAGEGSSLTIGQIASMLAESIAAEVLNPGSSNIIKSAPLWEAEDCRQFESDPDFAAGMQTY